MDLQGSLVDTNLRIYPSNNLLNYFKSIPINDDVPVNIVKFVKGKDYEPKQKTVYDTKEVPVYLDSKDIENLNKIRATIKVEENEEDNFEDEEEVTKVENKINKEPKNENKINKELKKDTKVNKEDFNDILKLSKQEDNDKQSKENCNEKIKNECEEKEIKLHLETADIDWLYEYLNKLRSKGGKKVPYLYELLEGSQIETPENQVIKRNPVLEARCVKLRAQQEAREYRKMTKTVDNVRMRFPEDSISYQLKQVNRQLIAIGQFIISIFAGFLFGFKGIEWMIGYLDFGFRLLMGVMCALIIALAEIYFLAKKLNEELNIPETVQLGGPPKFADSQLNPPKIDKAIEKEHQD